MSCEHWRDSRVLLEAHLQKCSHLTVGLEYVLPGSPNTLCHRALLNCSSAMLTNLSEFPENLSHDGAKHEEGLSGLNIPSS
jgi:hypothetical protein